MMCRSIGLRGLAVLLVLGLARAAWAGEAKNVIILVSDGGGFGVYNATSFYEHGRLGGQPYDQRAWKKYGSLTISQNTLKDTAGKNSHGFDPTTVWTMDSTYARAIAGGTPFKSYTALKQSPTDSAAAATALASGLKTYNGAINYVLDETDEVVPIQGKTIAEVARALGKSTGVVTTVPWCDATPAALGGAHNLARGNWREICNDMLNNGTLDVIMGTGHPEYDNNGAPREPTRESDYDAVGGSFTWNLLLSGKHAGRWKLVQSKAEFEALIRGPAPGRVLGVPLVSGSLQSMRQTRDWNRDGPVEDLDVRMTGPFKDPFIATVPSLRTMALGALNVLGRNPKGFYVMIEGGAVDKAEHANHPGRMIEEMVEFNRTVRAVEQWVQQHSNWEETLVIVTSDHETGLVWGLNSDKEPFDPILDHGQGRMPGVSFNTGNHSNSLVPLRARGAGADLFESRVIGHDPVVGQFVDNTSIFEVMNEAMGGASTVHAAGRSTRPAKTGDKTEMLRDE